MLKRDSLKIGQRVTFGSLPSTRRRQSLADGFILRFNPRIPWRKLQMWVKIRSTLGRLHQKVVDAAIHDPSSPFYMQMEEKSCSASISRNHYVFFDPNDYKANRQMRTSQEVKRILALPPERRSPEEIHCAMIGLRGISAIEEFPIRMQRHLAEYGTFESYHPKRTIVKQGRPPEAFYYILYGRVLVAVRDEVTGKVDVKCHLHRGHAFGELAIIKKSNRLSSVITKNYTELLCLSSEVFQKYFMVGGVKNMNDPDQTNFVRSLSFLKGWPIELILENTEHQNVTFGYFKTGSVLAKDSNYSDWLIIVKSVTVTVLISRGVLEKLGQGYPGCSAMHGTLCYRLIVNTCFRDAGGDERLGLDQYFSPGINGSLKVLKKLVKVRPTASKKSGLPRTKANSSQDSYLCFLSNGREFNNYIEKNKIILPPPFDPEEPGDESEISDNIFNTVILANIPQTTVTGQRSLVQSSRRTSEAGKTSSATNKLVEFKPDNQLMKVKRTEDNLMSSPRFPRGRGLSRDYDENDDVLEIEEKRTFLDDLDSAFNAKAHLITEADLNPQFVCVQTLTKGDVFGLAQCLFCDQPSLCVVSNGADCLLINKKLYLDNSSTELISRLRVEVSPYPSDGQLQEDLITRANWHVYKSALMTQIYKRHKQPSKKPN